MEWKNTKRTKQHFLCRKSPNPLRIDDLIIYYNLFDMNTSRARDTSASIENYFLKSYN